MKKLLLAACAITLVLAVSCKPAADDPAASGPTAPDMGAITDVTSSGAIAAPATPTEAKAILTTALDALNVISSPSSSFIASSMKARTAITPVHENLADTLTTGGGTIVTAGSVDMTGTEMDENTAITANTTYKNVMTVIMAMRMTGTITGVTVTGGDSVQYLVNGRMAYNADINASMDLVTGATQNDYTMYMNMDFALGYGTFMSIKRVSDGVGAKFLISYAAAFSKKNFNPETGKFSFETEMAASNANLKVYNDATNELVFEADMPLSELPGAASGASGISMFN